MHQGLTASVLETRLHEDCPQVLIEDVRNTPPTQAEPLPKKTTRAQVIKDLLTKQKEHQPDADERTFTKTTGYLKCNKCGVNINKRVNEAAFQEFLTSQCVDQAYAHKHDGHTHTLWQKGDRVRCAQCGTQWHLDGHKRIITTQALTKPCKGAGLKGPPPLSEFFKKKSDANSQPEVEHKQPRQTTEHEPASSARPAPRRLHFPTALDERDAESTSPQDDQQEAHDMESSDTESPTYAQVDFF